MISCWKCENTAWDASDVCRVCGRNLAGPPRPPTAEERKDAGRNKLNTAPPTRRGRKKP